MTDHIDFQQYIEEQKPKKLMLLYHWDTDGIASCGLFLDYLEESAPDTEAVLMHPTINLFFLTEAQYADIEALKVDAVAVMDINFPPDVFERLEKITKLFVFDNHSQTAEINKPGVQDVSYPAASQLVADYLMRPLSLLGILGMIGDQEDKIVDWPDHYPLVEQMMKEHELPFDELQRITKLVDTMYMIGDEEGLEYAVQLLRDDPMKALTDERFLAAEQQLKIDVEAELAVEMEEMTCGTDMRIFIQDLKATSNIISEVTRARAKQHSKDVILTTQVIGEWAIVYVRTRAEGMDLGPLVEYARQRGYNAGGKPEVAGVLLPSSELEEFVDGYIGEVMAIIPQ